MRRRESARSYAGKGTGGCSRQLRSQWCGERHPTSSDGHSWHTRPPSSLQHSRAVQPPPPLSPLQAASPLKQLVRTLQVQFVTLIRRRGTRELRLSARPKETRRRRPSSGIVSTGRRQDGCAIMCLQEQLDRMAGVAAVLHELPGSVGESQTRFPSGSVSPARRAHHPDALRSHGRAVQGTRGAHSGQGLLRACAEVRQ